MLELNSIFSIIKKRQWPLRLRYLENKQKLPRQQLRYRSYPYPYILLAWDSEVQGFYYDDRGREVLLSLNSGEALYVPTRMVFCVKGQHRLLAMNFSGDSILLSHNSNYPGEKNQSASLSSEADNNVLNELNKFLQMLSPAADESDEEKNLLLMQLLLLQMRKLNDCKESSNDPQARSTFRSAFDFIEGNYNQDIGRSDVAAHTGVSERHISHLFRKWTGLTFKEVLNLTRLEVFRRVYLCGNDQARVAAARAGFHDPSHFTQLFKKTYGLSPRQLLQQWQQNPGNTVLQQTRGFTQLELSDLKNTALDKSCQVTLLIANMGDTEIDVNLCSADGSLRRILSIFPQDRDLLFCHPGQQIHIGTETVFSAPDFPALIIKDR